MAINLKIHFQEENRLKKMVEVFILKIQNLCSTNMRKLKCVKFLEPSKGTNEINKHYTDKTREVATNIGLSDRTGTSSSECYF